MNLTKEMKDMCSENYKTLVKYILKLQINGNIFHAHDLDKLIFLKYPYY